MPLLFVIGTLGDPATAMPVVTIGGVTIPHAKVEIRRRETEPDDLPTRAAAVLSGSVPEYEAVATWPLKDVHLTAVEPLLLTDVISSVLAHEGLSDERIATVTDRLVRAMEAYAAPPSPDTA